MSRRWRRGLVAVLLAALATTLASTEGRTGWTATVGLVTSALALGAAATAREDPEHEAREAARHQRRVAEILDRYDRERGRR